MTSSPTLNESLRTLHREPVAGLDRDRTRGKERPLECIAWVAKEAKRPMVLQTVTRRLAAVLAKSLATGPTSADAGLLLLRVAVGVMVFAVHGLHKLAGGVAALRDGTPWPLLEEVAAMHTPAPWAAAWAATSVQLICSLLLALGLLTRFNALLLVGVLAGAVTQNAMAGRDPQLALLYLLATATLAVAGGGRWSLDARWSYCRRRPAP